MEKAIQGGPASSGFFYLWVAVFSVIHISLEGSTNVENKSISGSFG